MMALVEQERCGCGWALFDGECDCETPAWAKGATLTDLGYVIPTDRPIEGRLPVTRRRV